MRQVELKKIGRYSAGEIPVGQIITIGLIVVPLVLALIIFREDIYLFLIDKWVELVTTE